jgi:hypothetical protein
MISKHLIVGSSRSHVALRRFWRPDGNVDAERQNRLRAWLKGHHNQTISLTMLLRGAEFEALRVQALSELN